MRELVEVAARVAELERRVTGMMRHGTVHEVDPAKGQMRLKLGDADNGEPFLSPWVPYSQLAGAIKAHIPPAVGQQFTLAAPNGDWQQAVAVPLTWSNANASPSGAGDENVVTYGNVRMTLKNDLVKVVVGGLSFELTSAKAEVNVGGVTFTVAGGGVDITGGQVRHNGKNIGSTHIHGGVMSGGSLTDVPAN